jgi:2-oxoglutarate ferredoxin oxidoreductase subunit beta
LDPLAVALAAGATFIARGFSGRSHELADLIVEGLRWPGFAFIEVLSPCMAFRSEQFGWKESVHPALRAIDNGRAAAHAALLADDGYGLGILFKEGRAPASAASAARASLAEIEEEFAVCR